LKQKNKEIENKKVHYKLEYKLGDEKYTILFDTRGNSFVYDVVLEQVNIHLDDIIVPTKIKQDIIQIYNKLDIFAQTLKNENLSEKLYEETIELYRSKNQFNLLISLFLLVYDDNNSKKKRILCSNLLSIFKEINAIGSKDRDENLNQYLDTFKQIYLNASNIINMYNYDPVNFYGVILCYLNYYDTEENFIEDINKLYQVKETDKEKVKVIYEILVTYNSHFIKTINQTPQFFNDFIVYIIKNKDEKIFENSLNYIKDIETIINIINNNKKEIFDKYKNIKPIKLTSELKLKKNKNELNNIIKNVEEIMKYSQEKKKLVIYLTSQFWLNLIKQYNKPNQQNIEDSYELRKLFKKYYSLINELYRIVDKEKDKYNYNIKADIDRYYKKDEFAFLLNKNIREYFEINKNNNKNEELIGFIKKFNPYYNIDDEEDNKKYKANRDIRILDYINFSEKSEAFIETFRQLNFEKIFEDNILEYLDKLTSKIENISTFDNIMELIDISRIKSKEGEYYNLLMAKYDNIIKNQIEKVKGSELDDAIKTLCKFIVKVFFYENDTGFRFLETKINKLEKISSLIYNELIKEYNEKEFEKIKEYNEKEFEKMKEYLYKRFLNKLDDKENIILLINSLNINDKNKFLNELMKTCQFTTEDFYSTNENKNLKLLCYLNENKIFNNYNFVELEDKLVKIQNDLQQLNINKNTLEEFLKNENVIQKLELLKLILFEYKPEEKLVIICKYLLYIFFL
jgi:hypothetical protein